MQLSRESLGVLLLLLAAMLPATTAAEADRHLVPDQDLQVYHLSKRQTSQCLHFFLAEPPQRLQCLPQLNILPLQCRFLVGQITALPQILTISWFFSRDGIEAQWVQSARFEVLNNYVAFLNRLTVLNPLPGAYFCSVTVPNRLFDTAVLRVNSTTLQTMCLPGQSPTFLRPTAPRCATIGVPITTLQTRTELTVSNTINFGGGVSPTPTISLGIAMTMAVPDELIAIAPTPLFTPLATPFATPLATPIAVVQQTTPTLAAQQNSGVGTIVGAVIGSLVALAVVILFLVVCVIFVLKKRERNQLGFTKKRAGESDEFEFQPSNIEPLLAQPPPEGPPPVLPPEVEDRVYNAPSSEEPLPYEEATKTIPRYTGQPQKKIPQDSQSAPISKAESYYARPRFYKPGRVSSTSTHVYRDLDELHEYNEETVSASALETMYISSRQLEPYIPNAAKDQKVTEKELMLSDIENSQMSTDFVPSGSEEGSLSSEFVPSGSEEGSLSDEFSDEDESTGLTLVEPSSWTGKSPATGQTDSILLISNDAEPKYINTVHRDDGEELDSTSHNYVNAREAISLAVAGSSNLHSTKSTPATRKPNKKKKRNKSTPSTSVSESSEYTELTRETANYTSVYASTIRHGQNTNLSAWAED